jgi:hypothetical protein
VSTFFESFRPRFQAYLNHASSLELRIKRPQLLKSLQQEASAEDQEARFA